MTHNLRIERMIDAPPDVVFNAFVEPEAQKFLYGKQEEPAWTVESELDLRVGGMWTIAFGKSGEEPYGRRTCSPRSTGPAGSCSTRSWPWAKRDATGEDKTSNVTVTFEERDGKTLLTIVQTGFERKDDRDGAIEDGWPRILDALERVVAERRST